MGLAFRWEIFDYKNTVYTGLPTIPAPPQRVYVRMDRKKAVLDAYHNSVHPREKIEPNRIPQKKSHGRERESNSR